MAEIKELAAALVALQGDLEAVEKTANNPFFKSKYADLPTVMAAVQPLLKKHKLAVSQFITHIDGQSALRTILLHESGQSIEDTMPLLLPKSDPQGQGSAITYARRYSFMAVLGVVADEDDDGNKASKKAASTPQPAAPAKPVEQPITVPPKGTEITDAQLKRMMAHFNEMGVSDREERLAYVTAIVRRTIVSSKELTRGEAVKVIDKQLHDIADKEGGE